MTAASHWSNCDTLWALCCSGHPHPQTSTGQGTALKESTLRTSPSLFRRDVLTYRRRFWHNLLWQRFRSHRGSLLKHSRRLLAEEWSRETAWQGSAVLLPKCLQTHRSPGQCSPTKVLRASSRALRRHYGGAAAVASQTCADVHMKYN